jgi:phenylpropionate dioxygenase-like ring-hydroxylating dioxygenase large terminal subunit
MTTPLDNDRLTRVTGDAPLGRLLRKHYWIPFARSEAVQVGAAPQRIRLLGQNFVAFRGEDEQVGLVDEQCPHRRASLLLARVEDCSLRCVYHGWRIDRTGRVLEVPSEGARSTAFAAKIKTKHYRVFEGGGLIWAFLGDGSPPPPPPLPFLRMSSAGRWFTRTRVSCNWLQGFEGALDSYHINWLHQGWPVAEGRSFVPLEPPRYEIEQTRYGLRTAAIRKPDETTLHFRVAEFVAPFTAMVAGRQPLIPTDCSVFMSVPVDDENHLLFFGYWDETGLLQPDTTNFPPELDPNDLVTRIGDWQEAWGQDREAMARGHFSGLTKSVLHEDVAVQMSMGAIVERSQENLCSTDLAIVRTRRFLLSLLDRFEAGEPVDGALQAYAAEGNLPFSRVMPRGTDWRSLPMKNIVSGEIASEALARSP